MLSEARRRITFAVDESNNWPRGGRSTAYGDFKSFGAEDLPLFIHARNRQMNSEESTYIGNLINDDRFHRMLVFPIRDQSRYIRASVSQANRAILRNSRKTEAVFELKSDKLHFFSLPPFFGLVNQRSVVGRSKRFNEAAGSLCRWPFLRLSTRQAATQ
jgi:hypothetical protein